MVFYKHNPILSVGMPVVVLVPENLALADGLPDETNSFWSMNPGQQRLEGRSSSIPFGPALPLWGSPDAPPWLQSLPEAKKHLRDLKAIDPKNTPLAVPLPVQKFSGAIVALLQNGKTGKYSIRVRTTADVVLHLQFRVLSGFWPVLKVSRTATRKALRKQASCEYGTKIYGYWVPSDSHPYGPVVVDAPGARKYRAGLGLGQLGCWQFRLPHSRNHSGKEEARLDFEQRGPFLQAGLEKRKVKPVHHFNPIPYKPHTVKKRQDDRESEKPRKKRKESQPQQQKKGNHHQHAKGSSSPSNRHARDSSPPSNRHAKHSSPPSNRQAHLRLGSSSVGTILNFLQLALSRLPRDLRLRDLDDKSCEMLQLSLENAFLAVFLASSTTQACKRLKHSSAACFLADNHLWTRPSFYKSSDLLLSSTT